MYRNLKPENTVKTIHKLKVRIAERFPLSGLSKVCEELLVIANETRKRSEWISRPHYGLRIALALIILISVAGLIFSINVLDPAMGKFNAGELVQITEAGMNDIVLIGAAIFFLITIETRIKRNRALETLHELRSIAHVIDMHQLTKDPSKFLNTIIPTPSSPKRTMTAYELTRYLNYCSEMLSLTGKVAALYAQNFKDSVVLSTVNELENLTTGLSRKIWQKIIILHKLEEPGKLPEITYK